MDEISRLGRRDVDRTQHPCDRVSEERVKIAKVAGKGIQRSGMPPGVCVRKQTRIRFGRDFFHDHPSRFTRLQTPESEQYDCACAAPIRSQRGHLRLMEQSPEHRALRKKNHHRELEFPVKI